MEQVGMSNGRMKSHEPIAQPEYRAGAVKLPQAKSEGSCVSVWLLS